MCIRDSINKGDIYNKKLLDSRLYMNQAGRDISSLYMDDGYLAFYPDPIELLVPGAVSYTHLTLPTSDLV